MLVFYNGERVHRLIYLSIDERTFAEILLAVMFCDGPWRSALRLLNNLNQKGYLALMMICIAVAVRRANFLARGAGAYIAALSLSKAALISFMVLFGLIVVSRS